MVWSGLYNVAADDPHMKSTYRLLETMRQRSIAVRADKLQVPADLKTPARIAQGAGNYNAMCTGCHLAPGMTDTELSKGLYPAPPNLTKTEVDAAEAFWVVKHGIKASGMPAWGKSMDDAYIWNMAAFLQELPKLTPAQYQEMVESSGGHAHGGGETESHQRPANVADDHDEEASDGHDMQDRTTNAPPPHAHAAGAPPHERAPKTAKPPVDGHVDMAMPAPAPETHKDDGHQH
ncbi:cytochrome c family protein [Pseudoxanthomonas sacheonensis]|nr:cytochrome c family protein [Pseudoxanthomonas sacheonensis]